MAKSKNAICGGFVALNSGGIVDCYSDITVCGKVTAAGFCGNNAGIIKNSYSAGYVKKAKVSGGFWAKNSGTITDCFYNKSKSKSKKFLDVDLGLLKNELTFEKTYNDFNLDFVKIWDCPKDSNKDENANSKTVQDEEFYRDEKKPFLPTFIKEKFYFEHPQSEDVIEISTAEELYNIAAKINDGDKKYSAANYLLKNNINLSNKKWTPIGIDENNPFTGIFDGGGYSISNITVNDKEFEFAGFFGMIKNATILNLGIECVIKKGKYSGALAGVNEAGKIDCCFAICEVNSDKFSGGLVGKNSGEISHCFVSGKLKNGTISLLPWFLGAGALATIITALIISKLLIPASNPTYAPLPIDSGASKAPGETVAPKTGGNEVSFQFDKQIVFKNAESGGVFTFKNPGDSNHSIVLELQLTDEEIINDFGRTCRTPEEQAKIEAQPGYSPETSRQVIAISGSIPPGYSLDTIKLKPLQDGTVLKKGVYNAILYLEFYDIKTNEQAMLNSQLPVLLTISA
jgi:hypothetical protein